MSTIVDAPLRQELGALDELLDVVAARGVELDRDDELAGVELACEQRRRLRGHAERRRLAPRRRRGHRHRAAAARRRRGRGGPPPRASRGCGPGRRAAAAADEARPGVEHPRRVVGHVGRRREIDEPLADAGSGRPAFGWIDTQGQAAASGSRAERRRGRSSPPPQFAPMTWTGSDAQVARHLGRGLAPERDALVGERHLGHDGQVGRDGADGRHGEPELTDVREGLGDEPVHPALEQRLGLLPEGGARLRLARRVPSGARYFPSGPMEPRTQHVPAHRLADVARQPDAPAG